MSLNGGYAMIKHNATQEELAVAYKTKRPVLLYDEDKRAYWAKINEKEVETVDEETQETIITYEYSYQLLNDIASLVDSAGNPRFVEGEIEPIAKTNINFTYKKWSLCGTHLMIVLGGTASDNTSYSQNDIIARVPLPKYIRDKIVPLTAVNRISSAPLKNYVSYSENTVTTIALSKDEENGRLNMNCWGTGTFIIAEGAFRIQFDLLIDAE